MDITRMLFSSWASIVRILVVGAPIYLALLALLKVAGKHALAKSNAYGLVVTIALGSTLSSAVLTKQVALLDGVAALGILLALQYLLTALITRYDWASRWLTAKPSLIVWEGRFLCDALRKARLTESEVFSAVRQSGHGSVEEIGAVVLETNGSMSVIPKLDGTRSALSDVQGTKTNSVQLTSPQFASASAKFTSPQLSRGVSSSQRTMP